MGTKYKGKKSEVNALNAYIALMRCSSTLSSKIEQQLAEHKLTSSQFGLLEALFHLGTMSQQELSRKLLSSKGNITLIVDNLEKQELVKRVPHENDRRMTNIHITLKAKSLIKKIIPKHVKSITDFLSALTEKETETLHQICKKLGLYVATTGRNNDKS